METLVGTVEKIHYMSDDNDFKVFTIRRRDRSALRITGEFSSLLVGARIEVHGNWKTHTKYGTSFNADTHTFSYENNVNSICLYIQAIAKWIGPERSYALANYFKGDLQKVIEKEPDRLLEVEGIGEKVAQSLVDSWQLNKCLKDVQIFLHGLGLTTYKIKRIITSYGPNSEEIIKGNPWILCFNGFGFSTCDYIAEKLGRNMTEPQRYKHYIMYLLKECMNTGHLFLSPEEIVKLFNVFNKKTPYPLKDTEITIYDLAIHIKSLIDEGYAVKDSNKLYDVNAFFYENESARLLSVIRNKKDICNLDKIKTEVFIEKYEKQHSISLSDAQKDAIRSFVEEKIMIITGNPGTGKTTVVKALVQIMKELGITFELLTPTGIAAKRLGTTAECEAYTIHRRLGYKGDKWDYNALSKYSTQAVIVDEVSMLDQEVFYRLISALYSNTKLVFVGDNDQLPSVGPGSVLRELINSKTIKTIFLSTIFRQEECSDIIKEAKKIRDGDTDLSLFRSDKMADIWHISSSDPGKIEETIIKFATQLKNNNKTKEEKLYFQIITPRNEGPLSVDTLNIALQSALNPPDKNKKEIRLNHQAIRKGDRVIIRKNNYDLNVFNGDIGKVSFITADSITVDIEDLYDVSRRVEIPLRYADDMIKLAYVITIHKAQGGEYPLVIIPFLKLHGSFLLQRNLLYTAITRAKKKVIILGQSSAIESAIRNDKIQKRNTLFSERINKWMSGGGASLHSMFSASKSCQNAENLEHLLSLEANASSPAAITSP